MSDKEAFNVTTLKTDESTPLIEIDANKQKISIFKFCVIIYLAVSFVSK
jgi:hypothetical protein